jgi:hypothetical protein
MAAMAYALGSVAWGLVIAPFNSFDHHHFRSVVLGAGLLAATAAAFYFRQPFFRLMRREPALLLVPVVLGVPTLWADGGWRRTSLTRRA